MCGRVCQFALEFLGKIWCLPLWQVLDLSFYSFFSFFYLTAPPTSKPAAGTYTRMALACRHCFGKDEFAAAAAPETAPAAASGGGTQQQQQQQLMSHHVPSSTTSGPSYLESLVYSSTINDHEHQQLKRVLEWVESKASGGEGGDIAAKSMPGITTWCHACRKVSVISYSYYLILSREEDRLPEDRILSMSAYYTRMCMGAEMWLQMDSMLLHRRT